MNKTTLHVSIGVEPTTHRGGVYGGPDGERWDLDGGADEEGECIVIRLENLGVQTERVGWSKRLGVSTDERVEGERRRWFGLKVSIDEKLAVDLLNGVESGGFVNQRDWVVACHRRS